MASGSFYNDENVFREHGMSGLNELFRWIFLSALGLGMLVWFIGGWLTSVSGRWRDGQRVVELFQFGPWIRGICRPPGGEERYKGTAWFGRVRLVRRDYGEVHLRQMGFPEEVLHLMEGQVTGYFRFRMRDLELVGEFEGRRFRFGLRPPRITGMGRQDPVPRAWEQLD
ncbi:MAG: hypothetical protein JXQ27_05085 [Acidobacteria bacterium]|nr:hypothetical protein [Acidobacteriota bacterium]